ncbi:MAG: flippase [Patescibacteria group bacterium]
MIKLFRIFIEKLKKDANFRQVFSNVVWLYFDSFFQMAVGFLIGAWVARYLGPEQYGKLNYAISFTALFGIFTTFQINNVVVRQIIKLPDRKNQIFGSAIVIKMIGFFISSVLIFIATRFTNFEDSTIKVLVLIYTISLFFQIPTLIGYWFESTLKSKYTTITNTIVFIISSILRVLLVLAGAGLVYFGFIGLLEYILISIFLITVYALNKQNIFAWRAEWKVIKSLLAESWPILLAAMFSVIYLKLDKILVGDMVNQATLGNYSIGTAITDPLVFVATAITVSVYPAIISLKDNDEKLYRQRLISLEKLLFVLSLCLAIPVTLFSGQIIHLLYGGQYSEAPIILSIYIWSLVPAFSGAAAVKTLFVEKLQHYIPVKAFLGALVSILLNLILIPKIGAIGACISGVSASIMVNYLSNYFFKATRPLFLIQTRSFLEVIFFWIKKT